MSGTDHILPGDGTYCFGGFVMTAGRRIVVGGTRKVELRGHGTISLIQGNVNDGPVLLIQANATAHLHDFKVENLSTVGAPRAVESATTEAYLHDFALLCGSGEGLRVTAGRLFASQLRISNCQKGISCRGGEVFLVNYDCESLTIGISVDAAHGGLQWIGGRINAYTQALVIQCGAGVAIQSIVLHGVTAVSGSDFVKWVSGTVNRANIMGNTVASTTNGINWAPGTSNVNIPTGGLVLVGNNFNVSGAALTTLTQTTPRVNSKANTGPTGLLSETPIV